MQNGLWSNSLAAFQNIQPTYNVRFVFVYIHNTYIYICHIAFSLLALWLEFIHMYILLAVLWTTFLCSNKLAYNLVFFQFTRYIVMAMMLLFTGIFLYETKKAKKPNAQRYNNSFIVVLQSNIVTRRTGGFSVFFFSKFSLFVLFSLKNSNVKKYY